VKNWDAGKVFKRACDQIVIITHTTDTGIRIEAGNNRIVKGRVVLS